MLRLSHSSRVVPTAASEILYGVVQVQLISRVERLHQQIALLANRTLPIAIKCNVHPQISGLSNHNTESVRKTTWA
jgi:hypothetical protein